MSETQEIKLSLTPSNLKTRKLKEITTELFEEAPVFMAFLSAKTFVIIAT